MPRTGYIDSASGKYNLNGGGDLFFSLVDTTKAGEYTYTYTSTDAAGNIAEAT